MSTLSSQTTRAGEQFSKSEFSREQTGKRPCADVVDVDGINVLTFIGVYSSGQRPYRLKHR